MLTIEDACDIAQLEWYLVKMIQHRLTAEQIEQDKKIGLWMYYPKIDEVHCKFIIKNESNIVLNIQITSKLYYDLDAFIKDECGLSIKGRKRIIKNELINADSSLINTFNINNDDFIKNDNKLYKYEIEYAVFTMEKIQGLLSLFKINNEIQNSSIEEITWDLTQSEHSLENKIKQIMGWTDLKAAECRYINNVLNIFTKEKALALKLQHFLLEVAPELKEDMSDIKEALFTNNILLGNRYNYGFGIKLSSRKRLGLNYLLSKIINVTYTIA